MAGAPSTIGRPRILSKDGLQAVRDQVHEQTLHLNAPNASGGFSKLVLDQMRSEQPNSHAADDEKAISRRTLARYKNEAELVKLKADTKANARTVAFQNIRNPLSLCATLEAVFRRVDEELFLSSDDVGIVLNGWDKPTVVTTQEAAKILNDNNLSVAVTENAPKRRVVVFNITLTRRSQVLCYVIKIKDSNFTNFRKKPKIYYMGGKMYIMLYHSDANDKVMQTYMYDRCIVPAAKDFRQSLIERDTHGLCELSSKVSQLSQDEDLPLSDVDPEDVKKKFAWIALACDGAAGQVHALLDDLNSKYIESGENIIMVKYAAGCSMTQSANDVGKMHQILHEAFKSPSFRYGEDDLCQDPPGENWVFLKALLEKYLDGPSFSTIWRCLQRSEAFLSKAFTKPTVESAFEKAGVYPFQPVKILARNKFFKSLEETDAQRVLDAIHPLADVCDALGYIPEEDFEAILEDWTTVHRKLPASTSMTWLRTVKGL
jgi:hypothetical protein